jgi:hypothetical protein
MSVPARTPSFRGRGYRKGPARESRSARGFRPGNVLSCKCREVGHISAISGRYQGAMDPMLHIPKNRRRVPVLRLCVLMGLLALLFIVAVMRP